MSVTFCRDTGVMEEIATFSILPAEYVLQVTRLLAHPGQTAEELTHTVHTLEEVWRSVVSLSGGQYQPKFQLLASSTIPTILSQEAA